MQIVTNVGSTIFPFRGILFSGEMGIKDMNMIH